MKGVYTPLIEATLGLPLVIGLGPLALWFKGSVDPNRVKLGRYELVNIAECPYRRVFTNNQNWQNYATFCKKVNSAFFRFWAKMPIYYDRDCLKNQKKLISEKTRAEHIFSIRNFTLEFSFPSLQPKIIPKNQLL